MEKVIIVTGSSSGIGLEVAKTYLQKGFKVASCSEKELSQCKSCQDLKAAYGNKYFYQKMDATNLEDISSFVKAVYEHFGRIDVLVSNAGCNVFKGISCSAEDFEHNFKLNLRSHWFIAKECRPYLEKNGGVVLVMTSNHAFSTMPMCSPYNIAKRALMSLVQSITIEWAPKVRAVAIAPGFIDTEGNQAWFDSHEDPLKARSDTIKLHPVGRIGTPHDIAMLCCFLSSDEASFIAGTTILIDGGRSCLMQDQL